MIYVIYSLLVLNEKLGVFFNKLLQGFIISLSFFSRKLSTLISPWAGAWQNGYSEPILESKGMYAIFQKKG